jgi:hypothetical protein
MHGFMTVVEKDIKKWILILKIALLYLFNIAKLNGTFR